MRRARRALALAGLLAALLAGQERPASSVAISGTLTGVAFVGGVCPGSDTRNKFDVVKVDGATAGGGFWVFTVAAMRAQTSVGLENCSFPGLGVYAGSWNPANGGPIGNDLTIGSTGDAEVRVGHTSLSVNLVGGWVTSTQMLNYARAGGTNVG